LYSTPIDPQGFLLSLAIVIGIAMLFEGWYDLGRHGEDRRFNRAKTRVITTQGHEVEATWESLVAGDVVVVEREGLFPADLLMLAAVCNPKAAVDAEFDWQTCYVETSNIDGETNLKQRKAPARFIAPPADGNWHRALAPWQASYEAPRAALDFSGTLQNVSDPHASHASVPIEFNNLLLRGSRLKNIHRIVGVVVYAGVETKAVQSTSATRTKVSNAVRLTNMMIVAVLIVGLVMVIVSAGLALSRTDSGQDALWYFKTPNGAGYVFGPFFAPFFTYIILYSGLLPIALIIAITITNVVQAGLVNVDVNMYDEEKDRQAKCQTLELTQEIGQVSFLFSDKTGTLTRNEMKLVGITLNSRVFGVPAPNTTVTVQDPLPVIFSDLRLEASPNGSALCEPAREFLMFLAMCNTVIVDGSGDSLRYNAEGPDEEALVIAAAACGFKLVHTSNGEVTVHAEHMPHRYASPSGGSSGTFTIVGVNRFDSTRKRMSLVVRLPNGRCEVMCKGADSVMFERLEDVADAADVRMRHRANLGRDLDMFAAVGLRTLVLARREMSDVECAAWAVKYAEASNRIGADKAKALAEVADLVEKSFEVVGATAIEDRLQDGVPQTLKCLREAGIKTWVLTGDKVETAINISFSAGLLLPDMDIVQLVSGDLQTTLSEIDALRLVMDPAALHKHHARSSFVRASTPRASLHGALPPVVPGEGSGVDPYGMSRAVGNAGAILENGFHRLTQLPTGAAHKRKSTRGGAGGQVDNEFTSTWRRSLTSAVRRARSTSKEDIPLPSRTPSPGLLHAAAGNNAAAGNSATGSGRSATPDVEQGLPRTSEGQVSMAQLLPDPPPNGTTATPGVVASPLASEKPPAEASNVALVVSGQALQCILKDKDEDRTLSDAEVAFLSVAKLCRVVVACRVSPRQKALLVRIVRTGVTIAGREPITMAVGDGANDVAMIQEARVGVGVAGREGSQAVNAADFSIGQFRFLQRLLLVHGRWNYRRMAMLVLYIFYAHLIPVLCNFAFNFLSGWSGTAPFFIEWIVAYSYIVVIPAIVVAALNRDISAETALKFPSMYVSGRANLHLGSFKIAEYVFKAVVHGTIVTVFVFYIFAPLPINFSQLNTEVYWCVLLVVLGRLALEAYTWTWITICFYVAAWSVFLILEPLIYSSDATIYTLWGNTVIFGVLSWQWAWSVAPLVLAVAMGFDVSLTLARKTFFPNMIDVVIEIDRGFAPDKGQQLLQANEFFRALAKPMALPRGAVKAALRSAKNIQLAPAFRSAYAYDVPERAAEHKSTSSSSMRRIGSAVLSPFSNLAERTSRRLSRTATPPPPPSQQPAHNKEAAAELELMNEPHVHATPSSPHGTLESPATFSPAHVVHEDAGFFTAASSPRATDAVVSFATDEVHEEKRP